jgi:hypothetical protein
MHHCQATAQKLYSLIQADSQEGGRRLDETVTVTKLHRTSLL